MTIPDYQSIMLPLLKFAGDNQEHTIQEAIEHIADTFNLTDQDRKVESPKRSYFKITSLSLDILNKNPSEINVKFIEHFPSFIEFRNTKKEKDEHEEHEVETGSTQTPQELLEYGYQKIKKDLSQELLGYVKQSSPRFFERLVVELLISMSYGGSRKDAGQVIGQSGDGGVDGIIKEDKHELDVIYLQAKRWKNVVG